MEDEIENDADSQADETVVDSDSDSSTDNDIDVSVYEATIAERDATIAALNADIQKLKAHNYTLMSAQTQDKSDDTGIIHNDEDTPDDVTIDDLFKSND